MKLLHVFLIPIFSIVIVSSCKKDSTPPPPQKTRLAKSNFPAVGTFTYTYDAAGNMATEVYSGNASNPPSTTTFTNFDLKGRVTQYTRDFTSTIITDEKNIISYTADGKLDRVVAFVSSTGDYLGYNSFEYAAGKMIVKRYNLANNLTGSTEYTFTADGNNIAESKSYSSTGALRSTTVYSNYDDKINPDNLIPIGYYEIPVSKNNYRSVSITNAVTGAVISFTATFEYNNDGYPTKRTTSTGSTNTYEYIKQ